MNELLVICGPTATGKTSLGIELARKFDGEIVSADSRQIYKKMDIGTGKEWGSGVKIWGYDLVSPKEEFSVSQYLKFADWTIADILRRGKLPILVGGTGLYIKGVVDGIPTANIPQNKKLRESLKNMSADQLFEQLSQIDSLKAGSMNSSDKKNPRRLARAIEIATWSIDNSQKINVQKRKQYNALFIGLTAPKKFLEDRINRRVSARVKMGFENEIKKLLTLGVEWGDQSMLSLGYRQWRDYVEGAVDKETALSEWKKEERKYAKRQMVWWKNDRRINWFDISMGNYQKDVENLVKKWYTVNHAPKD